MNRGLLLLAAVALLGGGACAALKGGATGDYEQGAAPAPQFAKDSEVCAQLAQADQKEFGIGGEIDLTHATYNRMFDACMRASGYRRKQEP
jgi:hypothetical protein